MNKQTPFMAVMAGLILGISLPITSTAGMVDGSHWLVKSGDSVYSIARNIFPGNNKQQARLRQELVKTNPQVFKGNPNALSVGAKLKLPTFASKQASPRLAKRPKTIRLPQPRPKNKAAPVRVAHKAGTADPADRVGKVIINMGDLRAVNRGSVRKLARNSSVLKGDTLKTANNTHTQIRLRDGALISLRPNTEFRIADFRYNGTEDGTERGLFELIKGGFRTITGAIGHRNKQNYRVNTTVATIGIRGTHYGLVLCTDGSCASDGTNLADGLYGGVVDGAVVATNTTGEFSFTNDEYFHIASPTTTPEPLLEPTLVFDDTSASSTELAATDGSSSGTVATDNTVTSISSTEIAKLPGVELVDSAISSVVDQPLGVVDVTDPTTIANLAELLGDVNYTYSSFDGTAIDNNTGADLGPATVAMTINYSQGDIATYDVDVGGGVYQGAATAIPLQDLDNSFNLNVTGSACSATCSGEAAVAILGSQAENASTFYTLNGDTSSVSGDALLYRQ